MKKQNGKIKRRIIAIALSAVALTSFGTTTVVTASAAVTNTSVGASFVNDEKTVAGVVNTAINTAQGNYLKAIKTSLEMLPYGKSIVALFEYGVGLISDMYGGKSSETPAPSISDIKVELDKAQKQLTEIQGAIKKLSNQTFKDSINELISLCDEYCPKIFALADARYELEQAKKLGKSQAEIDILQETADDCLADIINMNDLDLYKLESSLKKCTQYMLCRTTDETDDNPFLINMEVAKSVAGSGSFGNYIYKHTVETFDKKIWAYYNSALTLYTDIQRIKIDELLKTGDPKNISKAKTEAKNLQLLLNGKQSDSTKIERKINAADALKFYKENIVKEELKYKNQYNYNGEWKDVFVKYGTAKVSKYGFKSTGDLLNRKMVTYIGNENGSAKNQAFADNFKYLNDMIDQYRKLCETKHTLTFREFFEENMGITFPESCRYLVTGQVIEDVSPHGLDEEDVIKSIPIIDLDQRNGYAINYNFYTHYNLRTEVDENLDNLCYLADSVKKADEKVAVVSYWPGEDAFDSFEEAWEFANCKGYCTIKLFSDVIAQPVEGTNEKCFGTGEFFRRGGSKGALYVRNDITLDLNGHTIDRNQEKAVRDGSVFIMDREGIAFRVIDTSGKKGVIKGGNTYGNGGAFYDTNTATFATNLSSVTFSDVIITGNHADGLGGGIFFSSSSHEDRLIIFDCEITNNTAGENGGGIYCQSGSVYTADVTLQGCVKIINNTVNNRKNNVTLTDTSFGKAVLNIIQNFSTSSRIGVNSTTTDNTLRITNYIEHIKDCSAVFSADNSNKQIKINKRTFGSSYYAEIRNA
ncbi:MAG: hypothetical protein ACI4HL_03320 [Ruminococcus sp.]